MALRLIEIYHQLGKADMIDFLLKDAPVIETWHDHLPDGESISKILLKAEHADPVIDILQKYCTDHKNLRIVILPVEATLPRPEGPSEEREKEAAGEKPPGRISIEETYQKLTAVSELSKTFVVTVALAAFVAALGLLKNDVAVIIGSMVIAPLLSPNMALSLATTLADGKLAMRAIVTTAAGFVIVLSIGMIMGRVMGVDPSIPQIAARSDVSHYYIFLALASGVAGAYSVSTGVSEVLVGVMVAVALLPPLVASGLLFGAGYWVHGMGALLLFLVNVVSINLAGVVTFLFQGIRPKKWWEAKKAKRAVRIAIILWIVLLLALAVLILLEQQLKNTVS